MKPTDTSAVVKLPSRLSSYIEKFEGDMTQEEFDDPRFAYRLLFTRKTANRKGQADRAIEFVKPGDPGSEDIEPERWVIKDTEKAKYRATTVVKTVQAAGYPFFGMFQHTLLWRRLDGKNPAKGYGVMVANEWFWYDSWIEECTRQCEAMVQARITPLGPRADSVRVIP